MRGITRIVELHQVGFAVNFIPFHSELSSLCKIRFRRTFKLSRNLLAHRYIIHRTRLYIDDSHLIG